MLLSPLVLLALATSAPALTPEEADAAWASWADFPGPPIFTPMDPLEYERSALFSPPLLLPNGCFAVSVRLDYGSAIQLYNNTPNSVLLDAEIGHLTIAGTLKLSPSVFLFAKGGIQGAYAGFMDQFLNAYHALLGVHYYARDIRPDQQVRVLLSDGQVPAELQAGGRSAARHHVGGGVDAGPQPPAADGGGGAHRLGRRLRRTHRPVRRHAHLADAPVLVLAAVSRDARPWRHAARPAGGLPEQYQSVVFGSFSTGLKARLSEGNFLYANFFFQTPIYRNTGDNPLDGYDGSLDFGWMYR